MRCGIGSAVAAVLIVTASVVAIDFPYGPPVPPTFSQLNPDYRERAGKFYEQTCLPGATQALARTVPELGEDRAREFLRRFIYRFLDAYIAGNGSMEAAAHQRLLEALDKDVRDRVSDRGFRAYLAWRKSGEAANPLHFLLKPGDRPSSLSGPPARGAKIDP